MMADTDTFGIRRTLRSRDQSLDYFSLKEAGRRIGGVEHLPVSLKILLENLLRNEDGDTVTESHIRSLATWSGSSSGIGEIAYRPIRVLMQDFTGVPAVVDLAAMRQAMSELGGDPGKINPLSRVDLVIDHSVQVDSFGSAGAFGRNVDIEMARNLERYRFLRWAQQAFDNLRVVPPGTGICHQVNIEYLTRVVWIENGVACPDSVVGTDSHTTMVNALAVLGWGVGGIEAEAAMLGQPISMLVPEVTGFRLTGELAEGATATDLVLTVTQMLRRHGVVGRFVEFTGSGLAHLSLADRATVANMAPEYGATCGFFPIDSRTLEYLMLTGRGEEHVRLVEEYAKLQGLWRDPGTPEPVFTDMLELDLGDVEPSLAGPRRPQDRVSLSSVSNQISEFLAQEGRESGARQSASLGNGAKLHDGDVVIAAITSCTNTSNPSVMVAAGLVAHKALERGLQVKPWVKTSLAPGSQVVTDYLSKSGLQQALDRQGFNLVGYGCTTCIGNSGPLPDAVQGAIDDGDLIVSSVLSGNRNFEGRVHAAVRSNYLASPPLVVAYALAGSMSVNLVTDPLGTDSDGKSVYLKDIWPTQEEIEQVMRGSLTTEMFESRYGNVFEGDDIWRAMDVPDTESYEWDIASTYIRRAPFFDDMPREAPEAAEDVIDARVLVMLGDSITTDHISPAGGIVQGTPAAGYLRERQVSPLEFNSYGSRRGNHEIMMRGAFANIRLRNEIVPGVEGGVTRHQPSGEQMSIFDASMRYQAENVPLVVVAGKEYGTGSSRDWAAKGARLLGIRAVVAESFERIHRSNLIGMGILPLQFAQGESRSSHELDGSEIWSILGLSDRIVPQADVAARIVRSDGSEKEIMLRSRIDTDTEVRYFLNGGILHYVLRRAAGIH